MDYPEGGSGAVVDALSRGLTKYGGELRLRTPVERILLNDAGECDGVELKGGRRIRARRAVISNAAIWNTARLLPEKLRAAFRGKGSLDDSTPATPSFMHLHLGIRADGLSEQALSSIHHIVVPEWEKLTHPQVCIPPVSPSRCTGLKSTCMWPMSLCSLSLLLSRPRLSRCPRFLTNLPRPSVAMPSTPIFLQRNRMNCGRQPNVARPSTIG